MQIFSLIVLTAIGLFIAMVQTITIINNLNIKWRWIMYVLTPLSIIICFSISNKVGLISFVVHFCSLFIFMPISLLWSRYPHPPKENISKKRKRYKNKKQVDVVEQRTMTISEKASLYAPHIFEILIRIYAIGLILFYLFNIKTQHTTFEYTFNFLMDDFKFQIISVIVFFAISLIITISIAIYKKRIFYLIYKPIQTEPLSPEVQQIYNIIFAFAIGIALTFLAYYLSTKSFFFKFIGDALHTGFTFGGLNVCFVAAFILNIVLFFLYPVKMAKKYFWLLVSTIRACVFGVFISAGILFALVFISTILEHEIFSTEILYIVAFLGFNVILLLIEFLDMKKEKATLTKESLTIKN